MNTNDSQGLQEASPARRTGSGKWVGWVAGILAVCLILICCIGLIAGVYLYTQGRLKLPFIGNLKPNAVAFNGEVSLETGFMPDPYTKTINEGGTIDAAKLSLGSASGCKGFVTRSPTFSLNWIGPSLLLRIFSVAQSGADTSLIIRDPAGNWYCNDDSGYGGSDPVIDLANAATGHYDIWLGGMTSGDNVSATLYITERDYTPVNPTGSASEGAGSLDPAAEPTYGSVDLTGNFQPDPYQTTFTVGGMIDISSANLGPDCAGYTASAPDFKINFSGNASRLRIFFVADQGKDTTLIVKDSSEKWFCNDDFISGSGDPLVDISSPGAGQFDLWVGTYLPGDHSSGTLYITGLDLTPADYGGSSPPGSGTLDYGLEPTFGSVIFGDGSTADPYATQVISGGTIDVSSLSLGQGCAGFAANAPDFRFNYAGSANRLRVFYIADDGTNTTLIISGVNAIWYCNDDDPVSGTKDPMVEISNPGTGQYDVWVGTSSPGSISYGTLYITELDYTPAHLP